MTYENIIENLKFIINYRDDGNFLKLLQELKNNYNIEISTKYLRNLYSRNNDRKKASRRIIYLLKKYNLKTRDSLRIYKERYPIKYKVTIRNYTYKNNKIELIEEREQEILKEQNILFKENLKFIEI